MTQVVKPKVGDSSILRHGSPGVLDVQNGLAALVIIQASDNELHRAMFHVMDMRELAALTAHCADGETFFNRLCQRWINVKIKGTGYIRSIVPRTE